MNGVSAQVSSCLMRESYLSSAFWSRKGRKCNWIYSVRHCSFLTYVCESPNSCHILPQHQHPFVACGNMTLFGSDPEKKYQKMLKNSVIVVDLKANIVGFLFFLCFNLFGSHTYECKSVPYWLEKYTSNQGILVTKWHNFNTNKPGDYLI